MKSKQLRKAHRQCGRPGEKYRAMLRRVVRSELASLGRIETWEAWAAYDVMRAKGMTLEGGAP